MGIYIYNKEQIKRIEDACLIAASVLDDIEAIIGAGVSTHEIDTLARSAIRKSGAVPAFLGYRGFPAAVCTSINEVVVHGIPHREARLKSGDIIGIDIGVCYNDYYGDTARSYAIGSVEDDIKSLLGVTRESLYRGIERAVIGNRISDISHAVESYVSRYGFSPVEEFVGHGIGRNLHEEPSIPNFGDAGKGPRIREGMVFAIEPMINAGGRDVEVLGDGWTVVTRDRRFSAHFEHTVAVVDGKLKF
mgnify:FL=1